MGTRIFVFHLKSLIKYGIIALGAVGIIVAGGIILSGGSSPTYSPGLYSARIVLHSKPVNVQVEVDRNSILSVSMEELGDTEAVFYPLFKDSFDDIAQQVVELQSTEEVRLTEDNCVTGGIILQAVDAALDIAKNQ